MLTSSSHFQVSWSDLDYTIVPKSSLASVASNWARRFSESLNISESLVNLARGRRKGSYSLSEKIKQFTNQDEAISIIRQISGSFKSGQLTAIIGPSGAGKTSLLNFLSRRREQGYTGELYLETKSKSKCLKISAIPQSDQLPEYLTVRENLMFASRLKNADQPEFNHEGNIERVSGLLGLVECLDTRTKKISGGELKRLAIAQELVSKPDILILDEPTSGLDSLTCHKTITVLKELVQASAEGTIEPIAIVLTIHQPQEEVFNLFDKVYVMANKGVCIYDGPPNKCLEFVDLHTRLKMPDEDKNPASFLITIASGEFGRKPIKLLEEASKLEFMRDRCDNQHKMNSIECSQIKGKMWKHDQLYEGCKSNVYKKIEPNYGAKGEQANDSAGRYDSMPLLYIDPKLVNGPSGNQANTFWRKMLILTWRCWISMVRDPKQMIGRILFHIAMPISIALLIGTTQGYVNACPKFKAEYDLRELVYSNTIINEDTQEELSQTYENLCTLFIITFGLTCANVAATTLSFNQDMRSSLKEYYNGWYTMPAYLFARIFSSLPLDLTLPLLTMSIAYPITGQKIGDGLSMSNRILLSSLGIILASLIGQTIGMIVAAIYIGHLTTALFASQAVLLPLVFLSGFIVRIKNMPIIAKALSNLSMFRHSLEITVASRYGFNSCDCNPEGINGRDAKIVGVPPRFNEFVKFWASSMEDSAATSENTTTIQPGLIANQTISLDEDENKIFKLLAKQISLFNTYGIEVRSCDDVKPFQYYQSGLTESNMLSAFLTLVGLLIAIKIVLFVTVKLVVHFRTSL